MGVCHRSSVDLRTQGAGQTERQGHECVEEKGDDKMRSGSKRGRGDGVREREKEGEMVMEGVS